MREIVSVVYRLSNRLLLVLDIDRLLSEIAGAENRAADGGGA
jgi:chemotaxis signal transduction protein